MCIRHFWLKISKTALCTLLNYLYLKIVNFQGYLCATKNYIIFYIYEQNFQMLSFSAISPIYQSSKM